MNRSYKLAAGICALLIAGCSPGMRKVESTSETNQKILRENEYRLATLENSVNELNTQISQLNNRVYEVRTKAGQKTSMKVVPVVPKVADATAPAPVEPPAGRVVTPKPATPPKAPSSRKIDPGAKPSPLTANATPAQRKPVAAPALAAPTGSIGNSAPVAGPSGQLSGSSNSDFDLALPPAELPSQTPAAAPATQPEHVTAMTGRVNSGTINPAAEQTAVPVPAIPESDLSLPPEHPNLPPAHTPVQETPQVVEKPTPQPRTVQPAAANPKGEEAAYKAALNAARSGRTAEGIRLFRDFLQKYPSGRYAANAEYWIGECLYSQGKYKDALSEFQNVNSSHPRHHKNADALYKAGMTMSKLGDSAGAREKFKTLLSTFPNSEAAKRVRAMGVAN